MPYTKIKFILVLVFVVLFFGQKVQAATINVTNGTSTVATDSSCSLREAIENANDDAATNSDCTAGSGTDTIDIQTDITLTTVDHLEDTTTNFATPVLTESLIINGNDHSVTRSGANDMQFMIVSGGDISLTISDLTISSFSLNSGTDHDGALDLHDAGSGSLTLDNVTFSGNTDGAIHSGMGGGTGDWTITDSTFTDNIVNGSGGIINSSPVRNFTVSGSTFTGNINNYGVDGAVITFLDGAGPGGPYTISITDSVFINNEATDGFGGVLGISSFFPTIVVEIDNCVFESNTASAGAGALSIEGGTFTDIDATITNSTFKNNVSSGTGGGGAIYFQDGVDVTLTNNTFSGNSSVEGGGAIVFNPNSKDGAISASFNTFSGNTDSSSLGTDIYQVDATTEASVFENNIFNSGGDECAGDFTNYTFTNNLSSDTDCGSLGAVTYLAAIADNGGDVETMALTAGSNAINAAVAGTLGCASTDTRGTARPSGSACDIGAYEYVNQAPTSISLSSSSIRENEGIGATVGTLSTTDADVGSTHTYSLACTSPGADDASFSTSGGNLLAAENFNFEVKSTYSICIKTNDGYGGTYDKNFTITVLDVDENTYGSSSGDSGGRRSTKTQEDVIEVINTPISEFYEDENQQLEIIPDKPEPQIVEKQLDVQEEKSEDILIKREEQDKLNSNQNSVLIEENRVNKNKEKKPNIIILFIVAVIVGVATFYFGKK